MGVGSHQHSKEEELREGASVQGTSMYLQRVRRASQNPLQQQHLPGRAEGEYIMLVNDRLGEI